MSVRSSRIRRLYAETFRRDERSLQMNAEDFGAFFFAHGRGDGFDVFYHFVARGGIEGWNKRGNAVFGKGFRHFENRIGRLVVSAVPFYAVNVRVDEAGRDAGALQVDEFDVVFKFFGGKTRFVENVDDFVVFDENRTVLHNRIAGENRGVVQADFRTHEHT